MHQKIENLNFKRENKVENKLKIYSHRFLLVSLLEAFHVFIWFFKYHSGVSIKKLKQKAEHRAVNGVFVLPKTWK